MAWAYSDYGKPMRHGHDWNLLGGEHQGRFIRQWPAEKKNGGVVRSVG